MGKVKKRLWNLVQIGGVLRLGAALVLVVLAVQQSSAIVVDPNFIVRPPPCTSPPLGLITPGCGLVTTEYGGFGLVFGPDKVAIFNDPPDAWGGVNANDIVDFLAPVSGFFVVPSTTTPGLTGFISVEAGLVDSAANILLEVFDMNGALLGSTIGDDGIGPNVRNLMTLSLPGIHSFKVSTPTGDTYGVDQIEFDTPTPAAAIPEPSTGLLLATGLLGLLASGWRRRQRAA